MSRQDWELAKSEVDRLSTLLEIPDEFVPDKDIQGVLSALRNCTHDSGRNSVVESLSSRPGLITADQMGQVLLTYTHDSGRVAALDSLGVKIANPSELLRYSHMMTHDSGRKALAKWSSDSDRAVLAPRKTQLPSGIPTSRVVVFLLGLLVGAALAALLL